LRPLSPRRGQRRASRAPLKSSACVNDRFAFPYLIVYRDLGSVLSVIAVAHGKRPPGYWLGRLLRGGS
jgi:hypothetical protein